MSLIFFFSTLTNLQPRPPPKSHAERQRRYMIRKKQKMLEEKLKKAQSTNDASCETAGLSADTRHVIYIVLKDILCIYILIIRM